MKINSISFDGNTAAVRLDGGKVAQFKVWDLQAKNYGECETHFKCAFSLCASFANIEAHMARNGFDATLEDIYLD